MSEDEKSGPATCSHPESLATDELPKQSGKEVKVHYRSTPSPSPPEHKIHPRQKLPPVPEGEEIADADPSPPVELE